MMRENINRILMNKMGRLLCLVLLATVVLAGKQTVLAAGPTELTNPMKDISCDNSTIYTATFDELTELTLSTNYGPSAKAEVYIYSDFDCTDLVKEEKWCNDASPNTTIMLTLEKGTYYFKFASSMHKVSLSWMVADTNRTFDTAEEFSVSEGSEKHFDLGKNGEFWWLLNVPTPGKYTFKNNTYMSLYVMKGKEPDTSKSIFEPATGSLTGSETHFLTPGVYTIMGRIGSSGTIDFTVTNHVYNELTAMDGEAKVLMGAKSKVTYKLTLTPAVNDADIKASADLSAPFSVTKVDKSTFVFESSSYHTGKGKVTFTSNDGFSKVVDVAVGPVAASVTSEGSHNSTTLKMQTDAGTKPQYVVYQLEGNEYKKVGATSNELCTIKNLKPNSEYTFKVVAYDGDIEGGATIHKAITAPNKRVTGVKLTCTGCKFQKGRKDTWEYSRFSGWYKVSHPARSYASIKVKYKKPKGASYVLVNGSNVKSGKKISISYYGRVKAGKKASVTLRLVRQSGSSVAYGPTVTKKVRLKGAK